MNPVAGAGRAERNLRRVRAAFERTEMAAEFVVRCERRRKWRRVFARRLRTARGLLFAMGGDGTVQALVNAVDAERSVTAAL